jgi:tetratricopeptide (TPR) repeat protein
MFAEAITHFARAMGAVHLRDFNTASQEIARLDTLKEGLAAKKDVYWSTQVEIQRQTASAWLAFFRGETGEALRQMRVAADLEGTTEKNSVTPGSIVPARELLAEMLVEAGQAPAALLEYEASLAVAPNRFNGLYGAAHAAELAGDASKAAQLYAKLLQITVSADIDRPELIKARTYTANR